MQSSRRFFCSRRRYIVFVYLIFYPIQTANGNVDITEVGKAAESLFNTSANARHFTMAAATCAALKSSDRCDRAFRMFAASLCSLRSKLQILQRVMQKQMLTNRKTAHISGINREMRRFGQCGIELRSTRNQDKIMMSNILDNNFYDRVGQKGCRNQIVNVIQECLPRDF